MISTILGWIFGTKVFILAIGITYHDGEIMTRDVVLTKQHFATETGCFVSRNTFYESLLNEKTQTLAEIPIDQVINIESYCVRMRDQKEIMIEEVVDHINKSIL